MVWQVSIFCSRNFLLIIMSKENHQIIAIEWRNIRNSYHIKTLLICLPLSSPKISKIGTFAFSLGLFSISKSSKLFYELADLLLMDFLLFILVFKTYYWLFIQLFINLFWSSAFFSESCIRTLASYFEIRSAYLRLRFIISFFRLRTLDLPLKIDCTHGFNINSCIRCWKIFIFFEPKTS